MIARIYNFFSIVGIFFLSSLAVFIFTLSSAYAQGTDTSIVPSRSGVTPITPIGPSSISTSGPQLNPQGEIDNDALVDSLTASQEAGGNRGGSGGSGGGRSCVGDYSTVGRIFTSLMCLISVSVIPLLVGLGLLLFIWGIVQVIGSAGNEEKREQGKQFMLWGIIGLFVIISIWGIIGILTNTFGFGSPVIPQLP